MSQQNARRPTQSKLSLDGLNPVPEEIGKKHYVQKVTVSVHLERPTDFLGGCGYGLRESNNSKSYVANTKKEGLDKVASPTTPAKEEVRVWLHPEEQHAINALRPTEWLVDHGLSKEPPASPVRKEQNHQQGKRYRSPRSMPPAPIQIAEGGSSLVTNSPFRKMTRMVQGDAPFVPNIH